MPSFANRTDTGKFDQGLLDTQIAVSFPLPPVRICSGQLFVTMRRNPAVGGSENDYLMVGAAPFDTTGVPTLQHSLWAGYRDSYKGTITLDLGADIFANAQRAYAGQPQTSLDLYASDDTEFDYITLLIVY